MLSIIIAIDGQWSNVVELGGHQITRVALQGGRAGRPAVQGISSPEGDRRGRSEENYRGESRQTGYYHATRQLSRQHCASAVQQFSSCWSCLCQRPTD